VVVPAPLKPIPASQKPMDKPSPAAPQPSKPSSPLSSFEKKTEPMKPEPVKPLPSSTPIAQTEKKAEPSKSEPIQPTAAEATVSFKGGVATGLIIDGRGLGLRPALLPKIVDQQGQELYVGQVVARTNAVEQGVAGYAKDVNAAANNFRVTDNPAIIKALRATGAARTDIVVGQADAQALLQISKKGEFLQYCRVIIVY